MSRQKFQPTEQQRRQVMTMTGFGIQQHEMARLMGIDAKTLRQYFRHELDTGMTEANVRVAQALYTNATRHNNTQAQIWWTRARMGWKGSEDVNIGGTDKPIAIDFSWAPAQNTAPTIEHEPPQLEVSFETKSDDE